MFSLIRQPAKTGPELDTEIWSRTTGHRSIAVQIMTDMLSYLLAAEEDMVENYAHRVTGMQMLATIRKLYVTGHLSREGFIKLLQNYEFTPMQMCEFIDVADDSRIRWNPTLPDEAVVLPYPANEPGYNEGL